MRKCQPIEYIEKSGVGLEDDLTNCVDITSLLYNDY